MAVRWRTYRLPRGARPYGKPVHNNETPEQRAAWFAARRARLTTTTTTTKEG